MALDTSLPDMQRQQAIVDCPRSMVGRVIGKGGETIKALQQYTGAMIQIDQSVEPTKVTVAGSSQSLQLAVSMIRDIVAGNFKGFALLRQLTSGTGFQTAQGFDQLSQAHPVYVEGYGFVPPSQVGRITELRLSSTCLVLLLVSVLYFAARRRKLLRLSGMFCSYVSCLSCWTAEAYLVGSKPCAKTCTWSSPLYTLSCAHFPDSD